MYADEFTRSMQKAISETNRRRGLQIAYNEANGINPQTVRKAVTDILSLIRPDDTAPVPGKDQRKRRPDEIKRMKELAELPEDQLRRLIDTLEDEMMEASSDLRFEYAARLRDEIKDLKRELREMV
jgi:excinuclease ABC subunit B